MCKSITLVKYSEWVIKFFFFLGDLKPRSFVIDNSVSTPTTCKLHDTEYKLEATPES